MDINIDPKAARWEVSRLVSLRYMVSPFAYLKWLDWIEIGVGLTYEYRNAIPMS